MRLCRRLVRCQQSTALRPEAVRYTNYTHFIVLRPPSMPVPAVGGKIWGRVIIDGWWPGRGKRRTVVGSRGLDFPSLAGTFQC